MRAVFDKSNTDKNYILNTFPNLVDLFFKNNWNNPDIVPKVQSVYVRGLDGKLDTSLTKNNTPDWNAQVSQNTPFIILKERLNNEAKNVTKAPYLLVTTKQGEEYINTLVRRFYTGDKEIDALYDISKTGVVYYYPVTKLGGSFITNEFKNPELSVLDKNNVTTSEIELTTSIKNSLGDLIKLPTTEQDIKDSNNRDNGQIKCFVDK
jgi:hypothetical protein